MAKSISVAVGESDTIAFGAESMVTSPLAALIVTGNAGAAAVVVVRAAPPERVVADVTAVLSVDPHAAATSARVRTRMVAAGRGRSRRSRRTDLVDRPDRVDGADKGASCRPSVGPDGRGGT